MNADEIVDLVRRRIESRYRRLLFVHEELERLNALAKLEPAARKTDAAGKTPDLSNRSFEDFVFSRINFSIYKKIDTEEFVLLFCEGLCDYEDAFYMKFFSMSRKEVQEIINASYVKAGPVYLCKKSGHLLLSIMRTLHTSLDFAPLLGSDDIAGEDHIKAVAGVLNGLVIRHDDGMETRLFVPQTADLNIQDNALLCGTFHPMGKACTITLIP
ncbi:MAG: hypothetical protein FWG29_04735 [Treponema sp.]|nr:hypothetical protein [Treponema sp.]